MEKYMSLQGGDVENQRQLLSKEKQIFKLEQEAQSLKSQIKELKDKNSNSTQYQEFEDFLSSGKIENYIKQKDQVLTGKWFQFSQINDLQSALAFGLMDSDNDNYAKLSSKGKDFFKWFLLFKTDKN